MKRKYIVYLMLLAIPICMAALSGQLEQLGITKVGTVIRFLGSNVQIGNGTPDVTLNGEDLYVEGTVEVDGATRFDGAVSANSTYTGANDITLSAPSSGGNAGARNQFIGLPAITFVDLATGVNGTTELGNYLDDSPTGEWAPRDGDVTESASDTIYRVGSYSYKMAFASTAAAGDGAGATISSDNLEANESIGGWVYSSVALTAGHLYLELTDNGGARAFDLPAIPATTWTWVEIDISSLTGGTGDAITGVGIELSSAGATALGAFDFYVDVLYKWDADQEEALGVNVVQDGVIGIVTVPTLAASNNALSTPAAYTDYFINYQSGNDVIVWMTDQSAVEVVAVVAYQ